jgi:hypothetical protein
MRKSDERILVSKITKIDKERLEHAKTIPAITVAESIKEQNKMRSTDRAATRKRNRITKAEERLDKQLNKIRIHQLAKLGPIKNLTDRELKFFIKDWYKGIELAISAVTKSQTEGDTSNMVSDQGSSVEKSRRKKSKQPAIMVSRGELTPINPKKDDLYQDKEITFSTKGFYGTPLPLIPDIRKSEVSEGFVSDVLQMFGVKKSFDRRVTLFQGPNKRSNRYLVFHYKRMIEAIDGNLVKGDIHTPGHVVWEHNFYKFSDPDRKNVKKAPLSRKEEAWIKYLQDMYKYNIFKYQFAVRCYWFFDFNA